MPGSPLLGRFVVRAASAPGFIAMCFQGATGERGNNLCGVPLGARIFQGREREIGHRRSAVEQIVPARIHLIMVEGLKNPVVLPPWKPISRGSRRKPRNSSTTSKPSGGDLSWSRNGKAEAGSIRVNVFHAPASDTTTGARNSARVPCLPLRMLTSTPTARPSSRRIRLTSWLGSSSPPAARQGSRSSRTIRSIWKCSREFASSAISAQVLVYTCRSLHDRGSGASFQSYWQMPPGHLPPQPFAPHPPGGPPPGGGAGGGGAHHS
jgi:hypothetical protein